MDTLHILVELFSSDLRTGAANDCLDLATFAGPLGLRFTFCGNLEQPFKDEASARGASTTGGRSVMISASDAMRYASSVAWWLWRLGRLKPDVVHLDYSGWGPSLALAAHMRRIPVVARAGAYHADNRANGWISAYAANCEPHAAQLLASPLASRVWITGSLFKADRLRPPFNKVRPLPEKIPRRPRLLFLGQLTERKGVAVLVEAFSRMKADADLLMAGGDWASPGFPQEIKAAVVRLGAGPKVFTEDYRPDAPALIDDCDVFVLPSLSDARPRSIIEAMYLGKPVVATRVGGIPTLVEDGVTGLLVPPGDPASLAEALDSLAKDEQKRSQLGAAAKAWARSQVKPEEAAARQAELYRRLSAGERLCGD